jgi:D-glycerate 3-kinase
MSPNDKSQAQTSGSPEQLKDWQVRFLARNQLPATYWAKAAVDYAPLITSLVQRMVKEDIPWILGINGCQGSGKSTLADFVRSIMVHEHQLSTVVLSLDDFYLTQQQRSDLAKTRHPLLARRGVPGTHDIDLALTTLRKLMGMNQTAEAVSIPRFNKLHDDRHNKGQEIQAPPRLIIFEGWCMGATPQTAQQLIEPINALEEDLDRHGIWRSYVNDQLAGDYQRLFAQVDEWAMLQAPSFDCVFQWRLEQEKKLIHAHNLLNEPAPAVPMSELDVRDFVAYFQRITEHCLATLPPHIDHLYLLNQQRDIQGYQQSDINLSARNESH